jgi:dihydroorotate dehydrogenase electron transfer subunit
MKAVYDCEIIDQAEVSPGVYRTRLVGPEIAREATAGQFVNVRVAKTTDPLLRRPVSVHATYPDEGVFSLLYVVVGRGTELLRHIPAGEKISVVGPLGRGFDLGDSPDAEHVVVAGGCGAAPLHFLCDALCAKWGCDTITVLTGGRSKDAVLCETEFRAHGVDVGVATDDASYGYGGFVTKLLEEHLRRSGFGNPDRGMHSNVRVYSCGPHAMMREVARICHEAGVASCQVSLENNMACGLGVCMGCVQKVRQQAVGSRQQEGTVDWHYERVCKDGPVFDAEDVIWE